MHLDKKKGLLLVLATAIISGFSIFLNSFGVKGFDSSVFTFSKNILVALFLIGIILATAKWQEVKKLKRNQWYQLLTIGLIGGSIPFLMFFRGLQLTTGTTSAFIHKTIFIYITIFAIVFLKEKVSKWYFLGALFLIAGDYFLISPDFSLSTGHLLILGATLLWAAENTLAKKVIKEVSGTVVAAARMFFGAIFIFVFLIFTNKATLLASMSFEQYGWIIITSLLLLMYVFTFYNSLKFIKVTTAAAVLTLGSPITTVLSWIFKGTAITAYQILGVLAMVIGVSLVIWFGNIATKTIVETNKAEA